MYVHIFIEREISLLIVLHITLLIPIAQYCAVLPDPGPEAGVVETTFIMFLRFRALFVFPFDCVFILKLLASICACNLLQNIALYLCAFVP